MTSDQFGVTVGHDSFLRPITLNVGSRNAPHIAVTGASGGGKSSFAMHVIAELAEGPDPVVFAGLDPSSVLLHPLRDFPRPELRSLGGSSAEAHVSVLSRILGELDLRLQLLLSLGQDKFGSFTTELPLIVVVFEEYPSLIAMAEEEDQTRSRERLRFAASIRRGFGVIVRLGAKLGVNALVLSQRGDASVLGGDIRASIATRITFRADNPDAVKMMHPYGWEEHVEAAHIFRPGQGLIETPSLPLARGTFEHTAYSDYVKRLENVAGRIKCPVA